MTDKRSRIGKPVRIVKGHSRLVLLALAGLILFFLLPGQWRLPTRVLIAWDCSVMLYLLFALQAIARFDLKRVRARAKNQDEGATLMLILTVAAALACLAAIVALLGPEKNNPSPHQGSYFVLAIITIVLSWFFIHTMFALHYAHEFYGDGTDRQTGGLQFPDETQPDYWDFVYFAFVIGMTFQVSDVQVTSRRLRRIVLAQGVVAFFFSVAILALAVNIGSNLI